MSRAQRTRRTDAGEMRGKLGEKGRGEEAGEGHGRWEGGLGVQWASRIANTYHTV